MSAQETDVRVLPDAGIHLDGPVTHLQAGASAKVDDALYSQGRESEEALGLWGSASSYPRISPQQPPSPEHYDTIPLMGGIPALSEVEDGPEAYVFVPPTPSAEKITVVGSAISSPPSSPSSPSSSLSLEWDPRPAWPSPGQQFRRTGADNTPLPQEERARGERESPEGLHAVHAIRASVSEKGGKEARQDEEKQTAASATHQIIMGQRRSYKCAAALLVVVLFVGAFL